MQVSKVRSWASYPQTYRSAEIQILLDWIRAGVSGAVIGAPGSGKSNLLGFLCHRPDVLERALDADTPVFLIPLDLNNLPANDLSTLYRAILRALYETRDRFVDDLRELIVSLFADAQYSADPFVAQTALRQWLLQLQEQGRRVVFVIDRFDWFCEHASAAMADNLRGLRDTFKDTVSFIAGSRYELRYYADRESLGELYELLDTFACWIQPMEELHARELIAQETGANMPSQEEVARLLALSGGNPALLKTACHWWLSSQPLPPGDEWAEALCRFPAMIHRLEVLWRSLTIVEQRALQELLSGDAQLGGANAAGQPALPRLQNQGIVRRSGGGWQIRSMLLAAYVASAAPRSPGGLWLDDATGTLFQGAAPLDSLSPLERALLVYLIAHPHAHHTHSQLIEAAWPDDILREGVSTDALYQVIRGLRRKVEPDPAHPQYIVNWRGIPEGGYRCFPEGRPG